MLRSWGLLPGEEADLTHWQKRFMWDEWSSQSQRPEQSEDLLEQTLQQLPPGQRDQVKQTMRELGAYQ